MFKNFNAPLFTALCEFYENNGLKPFVMISEKGISNPLILQHVRNKVVVLNFSVRASDWQVTDDGIAYSCRFGGVKADDFFVWEDVMQIWDGNGIVQGAWGFSADHSLDLRPQEPDVAEPVKARPKLGVIEGGKA